MCTIKICDTYRCLNEHNDLCIPPVLILHQVHKCLKTINIRQHGKNVFTVEQNIHAYMLYLPLMYRKNNMNESMKVIPLSIFQVFTTLCKHKTYIKTKLSKIHKTCSCCKCKTKKNCNSKACAYVIDEMNRVC